MALIFILLMVVAFLFCSKKERTFEPVLPPPDKENEIGISNAEIIYLNPEREVQKSSSYIHPQVSPILSVQAIEKIDKELIPLFGSLEIPENQFVFLEATPSEISEINPPLIQFTFVAPDGLITPDQISVFLDNQDISKNIIYNVSFNHKRNADFWVAHFKPEFYLNPNIPHVLGINFKPEVGKTIPKNFDFAIQNDNSLRIVDGGFVKDTFDKTAFVMNEIVLVLKAPEFVLKGNYVDNPENWDLAYSDSISKPVINEMIEIAPGFLKLKLVKDFEASKKINIHFNPADGIYSNVLSLVTPPRKSDRGGGYYRRTASYDPCTTCLENNNGDACRLYTNPGDVQQAELCEDFHRWTVHAVCPPPLCNPGIADCLETTVYQYYNRYVTDMSETGLSATSIYCSPGVGTCTGFSRSYDASFDVKADYYMLALPDPSGYCLVDELEPSIDVDSDTTLPVIDSVTFPEEDTTDPGCTSICCMNKKYYILLEAHDDHCMNPRRTIFIVFYQDGSHRYYYPDVVEGEVLEGGRRIIQKFALDTPDLFACATKLKVIVHDKKGNWNSHEVLPQQSDQRELDRLPYPYRLELSLGNRDFPNGTRQYVNLENYYVKDEQYICAWKPININNGPYIYLELSSFPPIFGVSVNIEWLDPPSAGVSSISPTNRKGSTPSPSSNPSLTDEEHELLWSQHTAWGLDGRSLGDNYNYFGSYSDCGSSIAPDCIPGSLESYPIRHHTPSPYDLPCFLKPSDCKPPRGSDPNDPECCLDMHCDKDGVGGVSTDINGRVGVNFITQSHGGDNFRFKATVCKGEMKDCICNEAPETITLWRKMTVDYSWMAKRGPYNCNGRPKKKEYKGNHKINNDDWLPHVKGVFDDCYIDVYDWTVFDNTEYWDVVERLSWYEAQEVHWKGMFFPYVPFDTVLTMGIDHFSLDINDKCPNEFWGANKLLEPTNQDWHTAVCVGNIYDILKDKQDIYIDYVKIENEKECGKVSLLSMSHELTHIFAYAGEDWEEVDYGIMFDDNNGDISRTRRRSYHFYGHIMNMREGLMYFDNNSL